MLRDGRGADDRLPRLPLATLLEGKPRLDSPGVTDQAGVQAWVDEDPEIVRPLDAKGVFVEETE